MKNIVIYVHGKGGSAAEAEHYRQLFPDSEVIGFDYHAQTPWEAKEEFPEFFAQQRKHCDRLTLVANSIGAFFSLSSLDGALVDSACLISPVVDMEKLIENMMLWADVTEQELAEKLEIPTDFILYDFPADLGKSFFYNIMMYYVVNRGRGRGGRAGHKQNFYGGNKHEEDHCNCAGHGHGSGTVHRGVRCGGF